MPALIDVTDRTFEAEVLNASTSVLVDFWTYPCPGCIAAEPWLQAFAEEFGDQIKIVRARLETNAVIVEKMNIRGAPNFLVFQNGLVVARQSGLPDRSRLRDWIKHAASGSPERAREFQWIHQVYPNLSNGAPSC